MQSVNLTDDQLWRAIAQNANAMTALIHQQLELGPAFNTPNGIIRQAKLRESNAERIGTLERNYREYTAELRRRYSLEITSPPRRAQQTLHQLQSATLNEQNAWSRR